MEERRQDLRIPDAARDAEGARTSRLVQAINRAELFSDEYYRLLRELFTGGLGEGSAVHTPLYVNMAENVHIGSNVIIMPYFKCMSGGNIYIEDNARIAFNVSLLTNNHDPYERDVLTIKDVRICRNVWIGAGSTILPGVTVGENAIVGAASVVTKDVPPCAIVVGNPARVVKTLDAERFVQS
ncbi:MAG: galactoside O-acetyltransferase [Oscillospiraceae bacterium]|nr:galactoside O-acetyltransferase [Oscillospiraceae bacterium]